MEKKSFLGTSAMAATSSSHRQWWGSGQQCQGPRDQLPVSMVRARGPHTLVLGCDFGCASASTVSPCLFPLPGIASPFSW